MSTSSPPPLTDVDYRATSLRPGWSQLPEQLHRDLAHALGSPVAQADPPVSSGFTGAYAGRLRLVDGRHVFAKASGPESEHVLGALAQEATVLRQLPPGIPAPRLLEAGDSGDWRYLVLEAIDGHLPGLPWTPDDLESVHRACLQLVDRGTPPPPDLAVPTFAAAIASDARVLGTCDALLAGEFPTPAGMPGWFDRRGGELALLARGATTLDGPTLCHSDLRPDNLIVDGSGRATILDWNWLCSGPAWIDFVGLLPLAAVQGVDVDAWVARSPLTAAADADEVDAFLATVAVYMVTGLDQPPPPGCTRELRRHQHLMAQAFLAWLGHRRGWASA